jgi:hypothetical protein
MRHGRRDNTHAEVRDRLRDVYGMKAVLDTADLGDGFPDLVLGCRGVTMFLEVKRDQKQDLRPKQLEAKLAWRGGPWLVVVSFADAMVQVGHELRRRGIAPPRMAA